MDRKHQFKRKSEAAGSMREKRRRERHGTALVVSLVHFLNLAFWISCLRCGHVESNKLGQMIA